MSSTRAVILFPPNWATCVAGPHLAGPLLAGVAWQLGWSAETWDLTNGFAHFSSKFPKRTAIESAVERDDFESLNRIYFDWEDQLRAVPSRHDDAIQFGLLSGYLMSRFSSVCLRHIAEQVQEGTVFSEYLRCSVIPRLHQEHPSVVGITIASQYQIVPAIELMMRIREALPDILLVLGGNIVTRLRGTPALDVLRDLADHTVLFQGDFAFANVLSSVAHNGTRQARKELPPVGGHEQIPHECWPTPRFDGVDFDQYVGTPALSYVSTRGCYWGKCHFCAIPAGWARSGYGGSAPAEFVFRQLVEMAAATGIPRVRFVDEAVPPSKVLPLANLIAESGLMIEWEAYARLEPAFENPEFLDQAYAGGLRKLYFGLEQAPTTSRLVLNKNDRGDVNRILLACKGAGIKVHLFCMVGHPGTSREDAEHTVHFLIDNQESIDTADLVGFRLDRGTTVPGVRAVRQHASDWAMSMPFVPEREGVLRYELVCELERACQETMWEAVPRLLHPLYRVVGPWASPCRASLSHY
jgi:hypothetical protein